jgi:probable rRNA maturation factor
VSRISVGGRAPALPAATVRRVVGTVLRVERRDALISVTFLGPLAMRRLNRKHKGHDRPTDVLSFPLKQPNGQLMGDIYVCRAVAMEQARRYGVPPREELVRLIVHGTLHVLGYDHPAGAGREGSPMWKRQEKYVHSLGVVS